MKRICVALVAVLAIGLSSAAQVPDSGTAVVKSVGFITSDTGLEISILIAGVFQHEAFVLSSPNRLVINVSPARGLEARPVYNVNAFSVTTIRTGQFDRRVSRVILDFSGPVPPYDIQKTKSGLVIKVAGAPPAAQKEAEAAVSPEPVKEGPPAEEAQPAPKAEVKAQEPEAARPAAKAAEPRAEAMRPAAERRFANTTVGITAGSYRSDSSRFREVYGSGTSIQFGLNLSRTLVYFRGFQLDVVAEARMISKTGKATLLGNEAKISIFPLSLAGRLLFQTKYLIPFVGYGADWFSYKEKSGIANTSGWASGDHFQAGLFFILPGLKNIRLKFYSKYTRVTATESGIKVKLGGPEFGIGLTLGFNFLNRALLVI